MSDSFFKIRRKEESPRQSDLTSNPFAPLEDRADPEVPTATLQVYQFIHEYLNRPKDTHINRASSATLCVKRRWYQGKGIEGTPLTPRKQVNFLLGDLSEKAMQYFVGKGCVGEGKLYSEVDFGKAIGSFTFQGKEIVVYKQDDLTARIGELTVTAHVDGWGRRNSDGRWELIEFKSAANWGFKDFRENGPKDYLKQAMVNLQTTRAQQLGATQVRFFFLRKETGHIWDRLHDFDRELAEDVASEYLEASQETEPLAPYLPEVEKVRGRPTGRLVAKFPCSYCPYIEKCQGPHEVEWKADQFGNLSPVFVFKKE